VFVIFYLIRPATNEHRCTVVSAYVP